MFNMTSASFFCTLAMFIWITWLYEMLNIHSYWAMIILFLRWLFTLWWVILDTRSEGVLTSHLTSVRVCISADCEPNCRLCRADGILDTSYPLHRWTQVVLSLPWFQNSYPGFHSYLTFNALVIYMSFTYVLIYLILILDLDLYPLGLLWFVCDFTTGCIGGSDAYGRVFFPVEPNESLELYGRVTNIIIVLWSLYIFCGNSPCSCM